VRIEFNSRAKRYAWLSNFSPHLITMEKWGHKEQVTVEHAYQACKTEDKKAQLAILRAGTPQEAKRRGRGVPLIEGWDQMKRGVMERLVRQKLKENRGLIDELLQTGDAELVEATWWHDTYWGVCTCDRHRGQGENHLGKIWMKLRRELQPEHEPEVNVTIETETAPILVTYAGIGSQDTPSEVRDIMFAFAGWAAKKGMTLRTGGAPGADMAFLSGCAAAGGQYLLCLPRQTFNCVQLGVQPPERVLTRPSEKARNLARAILGEQHWGVLDSTGRGNFPARNMHIVFGADIEEGKLRPVKFLLCWTKGGGLIGGTAHGLKAAQEWNRRVPECRIGIWNLWKGSHKAVVQDIMAGKRPVYDLWQQGTVPPPPPRVELEPVEVKPGEGESCRRCGGTGLYTWNIQRYPYKKQGQCFHCKGKGYMTDEDRARARDYYDRNGYYPEKRSDQDDPYDEAF